jgi:mRNA interferase MazF
VQVRRGDIVLVELNPTKGSEQRGQPRPCVIVQNDTGNQYAPTTIVAPFTTKYTPGETYPFEVEVTAANSVLKQDSVANMSQIRVVDIQTRIQSTIGSVPDQKIPEIDRALKASLGL